MKGSINKIGRWITVLLVAITIFSVTAYATAPAGYDASASISGSILYAKTTKVSSSTGYAYIYGETENNVAADFSLLMYTSQTMYTAVYTVSNVSSVQSPSYNYNGLAYAGYIQRHTANVGIKGSVYLYVD